MRRFKPWGQAASATQRHLADQVQVQRSLLTPAALARLDLRAKALVQWERLIGKFVRGVGLGQLVQRVPDRLEVILKASFEVGLDLSRLDRFVFHDGTHTAAGILRRDGPSAEFHPEFLAQTRMRSVS